MAKTRTISFVLDGKDNLSQVLANAQKNLRGLTSKTLTANSKALANAQAQLKNVEAYRKLQAAIQGTYAAQIKNAQSGTKLFRQWQEAQGQLAAMKSAYQRLNDVYKATKDAGLKDSLKAARAELKAQEQSVQRLGRAYDSLPAQARKLQEQLTSQRTQLSQLRTSIPSSNIAAAESALRSQIQSTTNALNQEIAALERRNQIVGNFTQRQQDLSNAYSNLQNAIGTAQTLMNPFAEASQNAMTFEKSMSRLEALTQMRNIRAGDMARVEVEMKSLTSTVERLGMTTEYTRNQIAGAANYYAMSGWNKEQIESILPATTDLASIAQIPIDRVADMLSDDMTAFGIKAGEGYRLAGGRVVDGAKYLGDAVAYATTQSNMDMTTFHESWKYNAPTAKAMGLSLGESIAQNMMLANAGIKGSMSGTSLRQFWVRMSAPPKTAQKSLQEMGYAANDATQQIMDTQAAMQEAGVTMSSGLFEKIGALRNYYRQGIAEGRDMTGWLKGLTGQTALSGVQALFEGDIFDRAALAAREIDSGSIEGWSTDSAKIMRDNTQTAVDYLTSALDALQGAAGDAFLPTIRSLAESFTPLVASFAEWTRQNPAVVQGLGAIAAAASTAIVSVAGFSLAMAGVRFASAGIQTAGLLFTSLATKLSAARVAIAGFASSLGTGLVARLTALRTALTGLTFANLGATLSSALTGIAGSLKAFGAASLSFVANPVVLGLMAIGAAAYYAYQNWDKVSAAFGKLGSALSSSLGPAFDNVGQSVSKLMTSLSPLASVFESLGGIIVGALIGVLGVVGSLLSGIATLIAGFIKTVADLGSGVIDSLAKIKDGDFSGFDDLAATASAAADNFKNSWLDAAGAVKTGILGTGDAIQTLMTTTQPSVADFSRLNYQSDTSSITQPLADASTQAADSLTQVQMPAEATGQSLSPMPPSIDGAVAATDNLTSALPAPIDGLNAVGVAASNAASALEGAASRINSVQINPVITVNAAVTAPTGKGFAKGGFVSSMTNFFAGEHGPEAILPLQRSQRSFDLWAETGRILVFDGQGGAPINISLTVNVSGNSDKDTAQRVWSEALQPHLEDFAARLADYQHERARRSFA